MSPFRAFDYHHCETRRPATRPPESEEGRQAGGGGRRMASAAAGDGCKPVSTVRARDRQTVWNHFQYSSPIQSETIHGYVLRRPDGCGLGRGLQDRADDIRREQEDYVEGNKRTTSYGLASGDIASTYLRSKAVTDKIAGTALIFKNGPNGETRNLSDCCATYANNNYIPNIDDEEIVYRATVSVWTRFH